MTTMQAQSESEVIDFLKELLNPEGFGYSVTADVRKEAKRILDIIKNEQNSTVRSTL